AECSSGRPGRRLAGLEHLANFPVDDALLVAAAGVARDDAAPEAHRRRIAQVLADLPAAGEAAEDELHRRLADAEPPSGTQHEELGHPVVDARRRSRGDRTQHTCKPNRLTALQDNERKSVWVTEPVRDLVGRAGPDLSQDGEDPRAGVEIIEVVAVNALDPQAVGGRRPRIAHTDTHCSHGPTSLLKLTRPAWPPSP